MAKELNKNENNIENGVNVKPKIKMTAIGQIGQTYKLMRLAILSLRKAGMKNEARTVEREVYASNTCEEAILIIRKFVEIE